MTTSPEIYTIPVVWTRHTTSQPPSIFDHFVGLLAIVRVRSTLPVMGSSSYKPVNRRPEQHRGIIAILRHCQHAATSFMSRLVKIRQKPRHSSTHQDDFCPKFSLPLIDELKGIIRQYPRDIIARCFLLDHYAQCGWIAEAEGQARRILSIEPRLQEVIKLLEHLTGTKDTRSAGKEVEQSWSLVYQIVENVAMRKERHEGQRQDGSANALP